MKQHGNVAVRGVCEMPPFRYRKAKNISIKTEKDGKGGQI